MDDAERCRAFRLRENDFWGGDLKILPVTDNQQCTKEEFFVIIASSSGFYDYDLAKVKCDFFLSSKKQTHDIIIITDLCDDDILARKYANDRQYKIEPHQLDWDYYGNSAAYKRDAHICQFAHALIVFGNLKEKRIANLINAAKNKLKIAEIPTDIIEVPEGINFWDRDPRLLKYYGYEIGKEYENEDIEEDGN
jgi:hypothetical protein